MDKKYWKNFYNINNINISQNSSFSSYVYENFLAKKNLNKIKGIELGSGNGRDLLFFGSLKIHVLGIDQVFPKHLKSELKNFKTLDFLKSDFTKLKNFDEKFDFIYSRFTWHSINEKQEDKLLEWIQQNLKTNGYLFIEARGEKNSLFKKGMPILKEKNSFIYENHYRRFINLNTIKNLFEKFNLKFIRILEEKNFAIFNNENDFFVRIVVIKK